MIFHRHDCHYLTFVWFLVKTTELFIGTHDIICADDCWKCYAYTSYPAWNTCATLLFGKNQKGTRVEHFWIIHWIKIMGAFDDFYMTFMIRMCQNTALFVSGKTLFYTCFRLLSTKVPRRVQKVVISTFTCMLLFMLNFQVLTLPYHESFLVSISAVCM